MLACWLKTSQHFRFVPNWTYNVISYCNTSVIFKTVFFLIIQKLHWQPCIQNPVTFFTQVVRCDQLHRYHIGILQIYHHCTCWSLSKNKNTEHDANYALSNICSIDIQSDYSVIWKGWSCYRYHLESTLQHSLGLSLLLASVYSCIKAPQYSAI